MIPGLKLLQQFLVSVKYNFDLSPNLSPKRREAMKLFPLPASGRRGLGLFAYLYLTRLKMAILQANHSGKMNDD
jgi:hypothetical protein